MGKTKKTELGKLGRNKLCFCGSEIKYKKCCLPKGLTPPKMPEVPPEVMQEHESAELRRQSYLQSKGIYISLPNTITFQGKSFLAVGNKIMWDENPHATFHQLVLRNLSQTLGQEWWDAESAKSPEEKHYIKRCFEELEGSDNRDDLDMTVVDEHTRTMLATGDTQALLSLAFDVWLLTQKGYMRDEWLDRLRDRTAYQGVRYEIGVASLFARMGCELEFYDSDEPDENRKLPKRAEFIATHPLTRNRIAVEAKSRHVEGVIHTPGTVNYRRALKEDITKLYKKALLKKTDGLPLIVFIDVNSPTEVGQTVQNTQWFSDIKRSFDSRPASTTENPDKYAALFVTNFSSHYQGNSVSRPGQYLFIGSMHPQYPLTDGYQGEFMKRLLRATSNYGYVPPSMDNSKISVYESPAISSKDDFIEKLRNLTMLQEDDPEYKRKKAESDNLIDMLVWDATQKSSGGWDNEIASECFKQFEWLYKQP
jgi:hypothetical protein